MDLNFFADPNMAPRPREEVQIEDMILTPYPDGRRVRVELKLTPFLPSDRPDIDIEIHDSQDDLVTTVSIVQAVNPSIALTAHLRRPDPAGAYTFTARLTYDRETVQHMVERTLQINNPA